MVNSYGLGWLRQDISYEQWLSIVTDFPFGPYGLWVGPAQNYKVKGSYSQIFDPDNYVVLFNIMHEDIPVADPVNFFQFGFVFDRDGNTANNYQASAAYPNDFFQDTDFWIVASYDPTYGWGMDVMDAANNSVTDIESNARMIIMGNTLILFVPRSEFSANTIGYRMSAYKHQGDWGINSGIWDGDVQPPIADGLHWIDL